MRYLMRLILVLALLLAGCTGPSGEAAAESDRAHDVLVSALDAWQEGAVEKLLHGHPSIRFVDDDLIAGWQLTGYSLDEPDAAIEPYDNVLVNLTLRDGRGKPIEKTVAYQVSLAPVLAVLRSEP